MIFDVRIILKQRAKKRSTKNLHRLQIKFGKTWMNRCAIVICIYDHYIILHMRDHQGLWWASQYTFINRNENIFTGRTNLLWYFLLWTIVPTTVHINFHLFTLYAIPDVRCKMCMGNLIANITIVFKKTCLYMIYAGIILENLNRYLYN